MCRYDFLEAAARDLFELTRHNKSLLRDIASTHVPGILKDPNGSGELRKSDLGHVRGELRKSDLGHVRAYDFTGNGASYRLLYTTEDEEVTFIAIGPLYAV